jgi:anthraniloyl-CoA monooxygenase
VPLDEGNWELIAPSPIPYKSGSQTPRAMDRSDMDRVKADYVRATHRARDAGFDMIELHMAHGYLLATFLSPITNARTDEYGGSLENRMRYPLEVLEAVRSAWPADKPMSVRISATDWVPHGFEGDDAVALSRELKARGVDIVNVSTGQTTPEEKPIYGRMFQSGYSDQVRNEADVPTMNAGNVTTADQVNSMLTARRCDLVLLARAHLNDPNWTLHAADQQGYHLARWPLPYSTLERSRGRL